MQKLELLREKQRFVGGKHSAKGGGVRIVDQELSTRAPGLRFRQTSFACWGACWEEILNPQP